MFIYYKTGVVSGGFRTGGIALEQNKMLRHMQGSKI